MEWVTSLWEKYKADLFFRTTLHVIFLQALLVFVCVAALLLALQFADNKGLFFVAIVVAAAGFGILLARFTLKPARDTLRYQRLFISNVAHELRTPLSTIKTSTEVALLEDASPSLRATMQEILIELDRISEIINNLLSLNTLTRPERMQFQNVDLGPIVDTVVRRHVQLARERGIELIVKKDTYCVVWGNATAIEQVITNLLKNAISYTPKDGNGVVSVSVRPDYHGMIFIAISDNGIGIAQEDLFHIFEPFYRADMSRVRKVRKTGSGLGLTIVNEIVRVHHGRITIQSALRKGTVVSVFLPSGASHDIEPPGNSARGKSEVSVDFSKGTGGVFHATDES